jgi:hypothetical protein
MLTLDDASWLVEGWLACTLGYPKFNPIRVNNFS